MPGDALGAGVGAVGGAEGVVDVEVGERRPALRRASGRSRSPPARSGRSRAAALRPGRAPPAIVSTSEPTPPAPGAPRRRAARRGARRPGASRAPGRPCRPACPDGRRGRSAAPRSRSSSIVGSAARIRVSSATRPPSSGTLKSTRTSTRRPASSASRTLALGNPPPRASIVTVISGCSNPWRLSARSLLEDLAGQLDAAVRVAPLVVVPGDRLDHRGRRRSTIVAPASKIEECGSPTMSVETIGSSV